MKQEVIRCKLGTIPAMIYIDRRCTVQAGKIIRYKEDDGGRFNRYMPWHRARVDTLDPILKVSKV